MKQQFKKSLVALAVSAMMATGAMAQNIGFEDGTATGWTGNGVSAVGTQTLNAGQNQWTINPYGSYMGQLSIASGSFSQMTSALSLTQASASGIQSTLSTQAQLTGNGGGNPTTASWASKTVTLTAGQTFTLAWQYISTDYVPFNDGSIATLVKVGNPSVTAVLNNYTSQYALLGFTNPGTGDYSTGSYGATGWQTATYTVTESGDYLLGFGVFNLDDTALSPVLYVDEVIGTTLQNGQTFGAVAPNPGTLAPVTPTEPVTPPTPDPGPTLVSNVTGTTGSDVLATGSITVNGGTIQIMMTGTTLTQLFDVQAGGMTVDQNSNTATMSGVISGSGNVVIANSGTNGSITFTAVNTYTGSTTINTGATLVNDGSIATSSSVTNNGTFTNNGQAPGVTNNSILTNNSTGTIASLVNNGTATNDGTITGTVTNTTGNTFTNNTTGTTGAVTNAGTVNNYGTTGEVTNSGTFTNNGIVGNVNTNSGLFINNATISQVLNEGVFNNAGTTSDVINAGIFNNSGTTGPVTNQGLFNLTGNGTVTSIVNNGTIQTPAVFNATGSSSTVNVINYSQNAFGSTYINGNQQIVVSGNASLAGDLNINSVPTAYGKYTYLTAGTVDGKYDSLTLSSDLYPLGYGLVYTGTSVSLKVTPSSAYTLAAVNTTTSNLANVSNLQAGSLGGTLNYDCNLFGENKWCVSTGVRTTSDSAGSIKGGNFIIGKRLNDKWRVGMFVDQGIGDTTVGNVKLSTNPALGGFANWNQDARGYGWGVQTSAAVSSGSLNISRAGSQYSEATTGNTSSSGQALQVKTTYAMPVTTRDTITPYAGLRYTTINNSGYTEQGAVFPITYGNVKQSTTDALAGISLSHNFGRTTASLSAGVIQNLSYSAGTLTGTSGIYGAENINIKLPGSGYTSLSLSTGVSYDLAKNQYIGASIGWQQKSILSTSILSGAVTYTVGF